MLPNIVTIFTPCNDFFCRDWWIWFFQTATLKKCLTMTKVPLLKDSTKIHSWILFCCLFVNNLDVGVVIVFILVVVGCRKNLGWTSFNFKASLKMVFTAYPAWRSARVTYRPGMAGAVQELTSDVPCAGLGHFCPGSYWQLFVLARVQWLLYFRRLRLIYLWKFVVLFVGEINLLGTNCSFSLFY